MNPFAWISAGTVLEAAAATSATVADVMTVTGDRTNGSEISVDEPVASEAARAALTGPTPLAKNACKIPLFETLVRRAILKAAIQS